MAISKSEMSFPTALPTHCFDESYSIVDRILRPSSGPVFPTAKTREHTNKQPRGVDRESSCPRSPRPRRKDAETPDASLLCASDDLQVVFRERCSEDQHQTPRDARCSTAVCYVDGRRNSMWMASCVMPRCGVQSAYAGSTEIGVHACTIAKALRVLTI